MSDLIVNVRQISNYPSSGVLPSDSILMQRGGLGGPYVTTDAATLVATALAEAGPIGIGFFPPAGSFGAQVFTENLILQGALLFNAAFGTDDLIYGWTNGPVGVFDLIPSIGTFQWQVAQGQAATPLPALMTVMTLTNAGDLSLPRGTLTVARDPANLMDVATLNWVSNNTAASFNGRIGRVQLTSSDVYGALQLDSAIATQSWTIGAINAGLGDFISTYPLVTCWNGRTGNVYLTLSDITCTFYQPGQQPISPTPALTSNDDSIATTKWVGEYIANEFAGGGGNLATQAWVLANTVNSFNGRMGPVSLTQADVMDVGAAPLNSPNFSGLPTAPTAAQGQATGQIATTAFVQQAIAHNTAGVSTFNTRTGDVVLSNADIVTAGGLANPSANLTGNPTAPTQPPGTSLPLIATCEFVTNAVAASVVSFNTRTGAVVLTTADITGAGGAPLVSPNFSSVPTAPTAAPGTNTVQLATCAFVTQALSTAGGVASFNGRTGAVDLIGNDISAAGGLVNPSVNLTGTPTAPTATAGTNSQQIATTAFVTTAMSAGTVTSFNTRTGAVTLTGGDISTAGGALLAGPAFTGAPTAPTATAGTNNTQLATTQFVQSAILADTSGVTSFNTRTGAVSLTLADITAAGGAPSASPQFTGTPQGPTATPGTATTQLATTQFVASAIASSGVSSFNARTGAVTLLANDISAAGGALLASPTFTGTPAAPTAAPGDNSSTLATTAFVAAATTGGPFVPLAGGTMTGVLNLPAGTIAAPSLVLGAPATQKGLYATGTALGVAINGASIATFVAGGLTMAQPVTLPANATTALQAVPLQQLQTYLPLAGGTVTGALGANSLSVTGGASAGTMTVSGNMAVNGANGITYGDTHYFKFNWDTTINALNMYVDGALQGGLVRWFSAPGSYLQTYQIAVNAAGNALYVWWPAGGVGFASLSGSDRAIKRNLVPAGDALATVADLRVYEADLKPWEGGAEEHWHYTLIADEVAAVLPEAYAAPPPEPAPGLAKPVASLHELPLVGMLVRAVQQLTGQFATLRERIEALEARMTEAGA